MSKDYFQIDQADWDDLKRENERLKAELAKPVSLVKLISALDEALLSALDKAKARVAELEKLINNPHTDNFMESVILEAAHQQLRWGTAHDAGKEPQDWFWLIGYLSGKAVAAFIGGNMEKGKHHIISSAAALLNWFRHAAGEMTHMQPSSQRAIEKADGT